MTAQQPNQPEIDFPDFADIIAKKDATALGNLYFTFSDVVSGYTQIVLAPLDTSGQPHHAALTLDNIDRPDHDSEPADWAEALRWGVLIKAPNACPESTFLLWLNVRPLDVRIRQVSGPAEDDEVGKRVIMRDLGFTSEVKWVPVFEAPPQAANDNVPKPDAPPMHPDPLAPEAAGGLLRDVSRWITSTAIVPVPELSMLSAAALIAGMFGDRFLGPTQSGLNLFVTTLLSTAGGKAHPPKAIRKLADKAGRPGAVTNGDPTSYSAIERMLRKNRSTVITMDEFGITLQSVNGRHANAAAASIRKFLLAVYDQANSTFDGRIYASSETKKDDSPIHGPALTVLGMTTAETLFDGLGEASISDGFINRFIFVTGSAPSAIQPPALHRDAAAPADLIASLQCALTNAPSASLPTSPKHIVPFEGGETGDAYKRWSEIFIWQHSPAWTETERAINGRAAENTIRLATIRAVSRDSRAPSVNVADVEWGWAIVHASINLVADGARRHMAASPAEALRKAIVAALEAAPGQTLPLSKICERRGVRGAAQHELAGALEWLVTAGVIADLAGLRKPGRGSRLKLLSPVLTA